MISKPKPARIYKLLDKSYIFISSHPFRVVHQKHQLLFTMNEYS